QQQVTAWCDDQGLERTGLQGEGYGEWVGPPGQPGTVLLHPRGDPTPVPAATRECVEAPACSPPEAEGCASLPAVEREEAGGLEALAGSLSDDEWAACLAVVEREAPLGIEVTAAYLAHVVDSLRDGG